MTIGKRISELRKQKKLSQETLAEELNVSRQAVSKWENDQAVPDMDNLLALAALLDADLMYLAYGVESEERTKIPSEIPEKNVQNSRMKKIVIALCVALVISALFGIHYYRLHTEDADRVVSMEQLCKYQANYALEQFTEFQKSGNENSYWYAVSEYRAFMQSFEQMSNDTWLNSDYLNQNIVYAYMVEKPEKVQRYMNEVIKFLEMYAEDTHSANAGYYVQVCRNALQHGE